MINLYPKKAANDFVAFLEHKVCPKNLQAKKGQKPQSTIRI